LEHLLEHDRQEPGLELLGRLLDLAALRQLRGALHGRRGLDQAWRQDGGRKVGHHITSMSACRAPAALMVCRMEIMSRGVTPSALSPETRLASDAPDFRVM